MNKSHCSIMAEVTKERMLQDLKWGQQNHDPALWLSILMEEVGEVAKASLEGRFAQTRKYRALQRADYRAELIQVAAVAVAMIECFDRPKMVEDSMTEEARVVRGLKNQAEAGIHEQTVLKNKLKEKFYRGQKEVCEKILNIFNQIEIDR